MPKPCPKYFHLNVFFISRGISQNSYLTAWKWDFWSVSQIFLCVRLFLSCNLCPIILSLTVKYNTTFELWRLLTKREGGTCTHKQSPYPHQVMWLFTWFCDWSAVISDHLVRLCFVQSLLTLIHWILNM